ncbi:hypothetical protein NLU13_8701 [Sarocladium strictum]|uniref:Uncharacterized protein n=1 Tax=Sarocladium strictum TaxID=5046 RepID=A0AA39GC70_SARSR|nr:hypothetical protein NLU13_8701 [Sarocladium strictum]
MEGLSHLSNVPHRFRHRFSARMPRTNRRRRANRKRGPVTQPPGTQSPDNVAPLPAAESQPTASVVDIIMDEGAGQASGVPLVRCSSNDSSNDGAPITAADRYKIAIVVGKELEEELGPLAPMPPSPSLLPSEPTTEEAMTKMVSNFLSLPFRTLPPDEDSDTEEQELASREYPDDPPPEALKKWRHSYVRGLRLVAERQDMYDDSRAPARILCPMLRPESSLHAMSELIFCDRSLREAWGPLELYRWARITVMASHFVDERRKLRNALRQGRPVGVEDPPTPGELEDQRPNLLSNMLNSLGIEQARRFETCVNHF